MYVEVDSNDFDEMILRVFIKDELHTFISDDVGKFADYITNCLPNEGIWLDVMGYGIALKKELEERGIFPDRLKIVHPHFWEINERSCP